MIGPTKDTPPLDHADDGMKLFALQQASAQAVDLPMDRQSGDQSNQELGHYGHHA